MGSQTTNFQIPYPVPADPPDGAGQMQALADRVDAVLHTAEQNVALLERIGSHGTWTRKGSTWSMSSDGYVSFTGANLSAVPTGAQWAGDAQGLTIPFDGVFLLNAQVKYEGASGMERIEVQIRQGTSPTWDQTSSIQTKHEAGTGSEELTIAGRGSMMQAGDQVRLYIQLLKGSPVILSMARVHALYIGSGKNVPLPFHAVQP